MVPSCTNPLTQKKTTVQQDLCPRPPQLSLNDAENIVTGRLDSETVFVDETLLRKGSGMDPEVYIRRIQAGFVLSYHDPPYAVCGCKDVDYFTQEYIAQFSECTNTAGVQMYALKQDSLFAQYLDWLSRNCDEYTSGSCTSGSGASGDGASGSGATGSGVSGSGVSGSGVSGSGASGSGASINMFKGDYAVDGVSANLLQLLACTNTSYHSECEGGSGKDRPVAEYYPSQTPPIHVSATIFYNNNVCVTACVCLCSNPAE